jgi:hypothetical protein
MDPTWRQGVSSYDQPNLGKYLFGALFDLFNEPINTSFENFEKWFQSGRGDDDGMRDFFDQEIPLSDSALITGRYCTAIFSLLTVGLIGVYVARTCGLVAASVWLIVATQLDLFYCTRMMTDTFLLFFLVASLLAYDFLMAAQTERKRRLLLIPYTVLTTLCACTKATGFIAVCWLPCLFVLSLVKPKTEDVRVSGSGALMFGLFIPFGVFFILHPQVWPNPVEGVANFFQYHLERRDVLELSLLSQICLEYSYQVRQVSLALMRLLGTELPWLCFFLTAAMTLFGLIRIITGRKIKRYFPLLISMATLPLVLSHRIDERYTWFLTVIMAVTALQGLTFLNETIWHCWHKIKEIP